MNMKFRIIIGFFLIAPYTIDTTTIRLSDDYIKKTSDQKLSKLIRTNVEQGITMVGESDASTKRLQLIANAFKSNNEAALLAVIAELKASIGKPMGGGQEGVAGTRAGGAKSGVSRVGAGAPGEEERIDLESAAGASMPPQEEEFGAPGAPPPPPPPPPSMPGATGPSLIIPTKKTAAPVVLQSVLTVQELAALSANAMKKSDELAVSVLQKIALEIFIGSQAESERYQSFIKDVVRKELGANKEFKMDKAFADMFIEDETGDGDFFVFVKDHLNIQKTSLATLHAAITEENSALVSTFRKLFESFFFDVSELQLNAAYIDTLLVNLVVSQRPKPSAMSITSNVKLISDSKVLDIFEKLIDDVAKQLVSNMPQEQQSQQQAETADVAETMSPRERMSRLFQKQAKTSEQMQQKKEETKITLSEDYVVWLRQQINFLRLEPQFLHYELLIGSAAREFSASGKGGIDKVSKYPVLETLLNPKARDFDMKKITPAFRLQLMFSENDLEALMTSPDGIEVLSIIGKEHVQHLKNREVERAKRIDAGRFIANKIAGVSDIKGLMRVVSDLEDVKGQNDDTSILKVQLKSFEPDKPLVIQSFKRLSGAEASFDEAKIIAILDEHIEKSQKKKLAIAVLTAARDQYKESAKKKLPQTPNDALFYNGLLSNGLVPEAKLKEIFNAYDRRAYDIMQLFKYQNILTDQEIQDLLTTKQWYQLTSAYGLITKVVAAVPIAPGTQPDAGMERRFEPLLNTLEILSEGSKDKDVIVPANKKYLKVDSVAVGDFPEFKLKLYVGEKGEPKPLGKLIETLKGDNFSGFAQELLAFVKKVNPNVTIESVIQKGKRFNQVVTNMIECLVPERFEDIAKNIALLNKGELVLDQLPATTRPEKLRNAAMYELMIGDFGELQKLLSAKGNKALSIDEIRNFKIDIFKDKIDSVKGVIAEQVVNATTIKYTNKVREEAELLFAMQNYLNDVSQRVEYLYNASLLKWDAASMSFIAGKAGAAGATSEGGIPLPPPPPPMPGGIPTPPPPPSF